MRDPLLISVRRLTKPDEFAKSVDVQRSAWGQQASGTIPSHLLIAAQHHGGLVLGAYQGRRMVGVVFGITAVAGGKPYHYSHITGVAEQYQSKGVGFKLKKAQRDHVIRWGQDLVKWTFDPLQAGNGYFNIRKLGAVCRTYWRNLYGELNDSLNCGRLTDRFEAEWWVKTRRVRERMDQTNRALSLSDALRDAELANVTERMGSGLRRPVSVRLGLKGRKVLVEIPEDIVRVRDKRLELARAWTLHVRMLFENYFQKGYVVTDVIVDRMLSERRVAYLLESNLRL